MSCQDNDSIDTILKPINIPKNYTVYSKKRLDDFRELINKRSKKTSVLLPFLFEAWKYSYVHAKYGKVRTAGTFQTQF